MLHEHPQHGRLYTRWLRGTCFACSGRLWRIMLGKSLNEAAFGDLEGRGWTHRVYRESSIQDDTLPVELLSEPSTL